MGILKQDTIAEAKNKLDLHFQGREWKTEEIMVTQAVGRYLAEDIVSTEAVGDIEEGEVLYKAGHRVRAKDIAVLAAAGKAILRVFGKPIVSILAVGEELVSVIDKPAPGQIRDGNSFVLACLAEQTGAEKGQIFLVKEIDRLEEFLGYAINRSDVVLLSGGNSPEDRDRMAEAIDAIGAPGVVSCGISMEPGAGTVTGIMVDAQCHCENRMSALSIAFPGDPVGMMVGYRVIADYFIKKHYFHGKQEEVIFSAVAGEDLNPAKDGGEETTSFVVVKLEKAENSDFLAVPVSAGLAGLRDAEGYVEIHPGSEAVKKGTSVQVKMFD